MAWTNDELARRFAEIAELLELDGADRFRVRAYERAAGAIKAASEDLGEVELERLTEVDGIGDSVAEKILEYRERGEIGLLAELRGRVPEGVTTLLRVPGLGPKLARRLYDELGLADLDALAAALDDGRVAALEGMGERSAARLRDGLERLGAKDAGRTAVADVLGLVDELCARLGRLAAVERVEVAGSLRRMRETVGDVDVLVASDRAPEAMAAVRDDADLVAEVLADGETKLSVVTTGPGVQLDVRVVAASSWGAALVYFTGSKAHNVRIRERAVRRGLTVNEYAVAERDGGAVVAAASEGEVYAALDLPWIPPTLREDAGEIEAADEGRLPRVVTVEDLRGDLHCHTDVSGDARGGLEEMVAAAAEHGLEWIALTDHAEDLRINGASREQLLARRQAIAELADRYHVVVLEGLELNIDAEGGVDYDPEFLATFDWCVASVHTLLDRDEAFQTERVCRAMADPAVHAIGHPTGRLVGRRPGYELDWDRVLETAVATGTALEVNGAPERLDLAGDVVRRATDAGVTLAIGSDAHSVSGLGNLRYGVATAQRGWAEPRHVLNCRGAEGVADHVARKRRG